MAQDHTALYPVAITTGRLLLREWEDNQHHHELMHALESQPEVVRYQNWPPRSREEAAELVTAIVTSQRSMPRSHLELAVFLLDGVGPGGAGFIGRVGSRISHGAADARKADLWFAFLPAAQGRGYATEAMEAFIAVLERAGLERMEIECDPRNRGSRRLAARLGFEQVREVERAWESKGEWVGSLEFRKGLWTD